MKVEVNKSIELVQILLFLSEKQDITKQILENNIYCSDIIEWFKKYKNHPAVIKTKWLINNKGFYAIRAIKAILYLDSIISSKDHALYEWGFLVKTFIVESNFESFYKSQKIYYDGILKNIKSFDLCKWINFIDEYFHQRFHDSHLVICPMAGNYGFLLEDNNVSIPYIVVCQPYGCHESKYVSFAKGLAHEYAHCFINPIVFSHREKLENYSNFFEKHINVPNVYNKFYTIVCEYFVRAFQIRFMEINKELFPDFDIQAEYYRHSHMFIFIDRFLKALENYEKSDLNFEEFYLLILDSLFVE